MSTTKDSHTMTEAEAVFVHSMGKALRVTALCFGEDAANAYMARHDAAALVAECGPFCLLADKHDKGASLHAPKREARISELEAQLARVTAERDRCAEALGVIAKRAWYSPQREDVAREMQSIARAALRSIPDNGGAQ